MASSWYQNRPFYVVLTSRSISQESEQQIGNDEEPKRETDWFQAEAQASDCFVLAAGSGFAVRYCFF